MLFNLQLPLSLSNRMDWGNHFNEWTFCYENKQKPGYFFNLKDYPNRKQMVTTLFTDIFTHDVISF